MTLKMLLCVALALFASQAFADARLVPPDLSIDPLTMSDKELLAHPEIPPKPSKKIAPEQYDLWRKAMTSYHMGVKEGKIEPVLDRDGKPMHMYGKSYIQSNNHFAGLIAYNNGTVFYDPKRSSNRASFTVPWFGGTPWNPDGTPIWMNGACAQPGFYQYQAGGVWVGMGGYGPGGLLQAGIQYNLTFDTNCNLAWPYGAVNRVRPFWEWYPDNSAHYFPLPDVAENDVVTAYVWGAADSSSHGYAYFANLTKGQSATIEYRASAANALNGTSFTWNYESSFFGYRAPVLFGHNYGGVINVGTLATDQNGHQYGAGLTTYSNLLYEDTCLLTGCTAKFVTTVDVGTRTMSLRSYSWKQ